MRAWHSFGTSLFALAALSGALHANGVRNLNAPQSPSYPTLQAAIDEAQEGDVLLVAPGTYPSFTLDGKGLSIIAVEAGTVRITDAIAVRNTSTPVWISGLRVEDDAWGWWGQERPGVAFEDCTGGVRLQDVTVVISRTRAAHIGNCSSVAIAQCAFSSFHYDYESGEGALTVDGSTVVLHESRARGADGHLKEIGTAGLMARDSVLFCAGSHLYGGDGGGADDDDDECGSPGDSGLKAPGALVLDNTYHGGAWGSGFWGPCPLPPAPAFIPPLRELAGRSRSIEAASLLVDDERLSVDVRGVPGDRVWIFEAGQTDFEMDLARNGWWLIPQPGFIPATPDGIIPSSGVLSLEHAVALMSPTTAVERLELQALVEDSQGGWFLTNARQVWRLSHRSRPDCDGDGLQDHAAILAGLVPDLDGDLVPDACASGPQTLFVDAAASSFGTGSLQHPFRSIASGVAKARAGDTVVVADGLYTGSANRNLNFFGRDVELRSANGPQDCVIDCEKLGRAFLATHQETIAAVVQGFTIRRGDASATATYNDWQGGGIFVWESALSVRDCRIEACVAPSSGGAVFQGYGDIVIERCVLAGNSAPYGGGLNLERGSGLVSGTTLEFNRSYVGAGVAVDLWTDYSARAEFAGCTFRGNVAVDLAGGAHLWARETSMVRFESCLFVGNRAPRGSALLTELANLELSDCTIAQNENLPSSAPVVLVDYDNFHLYDPLTVIRNTILWSNFPTGGTTVRIEYAGLLDIDSCDVEGGAASIVHPAAWPPLVGAHLLDVDPRFRDPFGPDGDPFTPADNDLRLALDSACIDAGDNAAIARDWADLDGDGDRMEPTPFDLLRRRRRLDVPSVPDTGLGAAPLVDLGCYERSATEP